MTGRNTTRPAGGAQALPPVRTLDLPCVVCGHLATNWHEKLPRGRGGPRDAMNAVPLCGSGTTGCHGYVTEHPEWSTTAGLNVPGYLTWKHDVWTYAGPDDAYRAHYTGPWWSLDTCRCGDVRSYHEPPYDPGHATGPCRLCADGAVRCIGFAMLHPAADVTVPTSRYLHLLDSLGTDRVDVLAGLLDVPGVEAARLARADEWNGVEASPILDAVAAALA